MEVTVLGTWPGTHTGAEATLRDSCPWVGHRKTVRMPRAAEENKKGTIAL